MFAFLRYHLGIITQSHTQWIEHKFVKACNKGGDKERIKGMCWMGWDLGANDDLTAVARLFKTGSKVLEITRNDEVIQEEVDTFALLLNVVCTQNKIDVANRNTEGVSYYQWYTGGWIELAGDTSTDFGYVQELIEEHIKRHNVRKCSFDPRFAIQMVTSIEKKFMGKGKDFLMSNNMTAAEVTAPMRFLENLIRNGQLETFGNPVFEWSIGNVQVQVTGQVQGTGKGYIHPNKSKAKDKIDPIVAAILACDAYLNDEYKDNQKIGEFHVI